MAGPCCKPCDEIQVSSEKVNKAKLKLQKLQEEADEHS